MYVFNSHESRIAGRGIVTNDRNLVPSISQSTSQQRVMDFPAKNH